MIINRELDKIIKILLLCNDKSLYAIMDIIVNIPDILIDRYNSHNGDVCYAYRDNNNTYMYRIGYIDNGIKIDYRVFNDNITNRWIIEIKDIISDLDIFDSLCTFNYDKIISFGNRIVNYNEDIICEIDDYEDDYIIVKISKNDILGVNETFRKINLCKLEDSIDKDWVKKKIRKRSFGGNIYE